MTNQNQPGQQNQRPPGQNRPAARRWSEDRVSKARLPARATKIPGSRTIKIERQRHVTDRNKKETARFWRAVFIHEHLKSPAGWRGFLSSTGRRNCRAGIKVVLDAQLWMVDAHGIEPW